MPRWHVALRVMVYQRDGSKLRRRARQSRRAQTWPSPSFFAAQATFALSLSRNTRVTQQSRRGKQWKSRRLCLSAPDDSDIVGAVGPECGGDATSPEVRNKRGTPGPTRQLYTRAWRLGTNWVIIICRETPVEPTTRDRPLLRAVSRG